MLLNKHQIFAFDDLESKVVDMKAEWGGDVKIKCLSVAEQLENDAFIAQNPSEIEMAIKLIVLSCVDENNNKLFSDDDFNFLKEKKMKSLGKLVKEILKLNRQEAEDVDNLAKNS